MVDWALNKYLSLFQKGQHLDPFLVNFEKSTEAPKPKPRWVYSKRGKKVVLSTCRGGYANQRLYLNLDASLLDPGQSHPHMHALTHTHSVILLSFD